MRTYWGFAKEHYLAANLSQLTFHTAIDYLRNFFEGPGYNRRNLGKLNVKNLKLIISQNSNKTTSECLQFLVHTLREIQHGLSEDLRTNSFLHDKLITACQGVPACRYAIANPPTKVGELLKNLQNSITAYEEEENSTQKTAHENAYFTDRRYHRSEQNSVSYKRFQRNNRCYVCGKEQCRSWKHTNDKREAAKFKLKNSLKDRLNSRHIDNDRFQKCYRQYVVECEGEDAIDYDEIENFENAFKTLTVEIQNEPKE
ncbi:hypothetical protein Golomagni_06465 [Golovinomyces magnicellulatus]|nr:hypothetical protein Golomagni_06465 [Golovinomyces magnicellulatus]